MLPFSLQLKRGEPPAQQVLQAVREAVLRGQLRDGDPFPSATALSQELRISPRAAQRVVHSLKEEGLLAQQTGSGLLVRVTGGSEDIGSAGLRLVTEGHSPSERALSGERSLGFLGRPEDGVDGKRIDDYEIRRFIARGGMGLVFEAFDLRLHRAVALKVLAPQLAVSELARSRFLREARAAAGVDHENVLPVHQVGECDGFPYLVMPLVTGESLQARLRRVGALPLSEFLTIGIKVTRGLAAAHGCGLIHRDLKPDNVLLEHPPGHRVWLADFGLARAFQGEELTGSGIIAGTPKFASPEQAEGRELDFRSDLFSLGTVFYRMVTGKVPFEGETPMAVLKQIVDGVPKPPREAVPELPETLESLVLALLEKDAEKRPGGASEVVAVLEDVARGLVGRRGRS